MIRATGRHNLVCGIPLLLSGCASVAMAPGSEAVQITKSAVDVKDCRAVGNVDSKTAPGKLWNATPILRNQVIGFGGDTLLVTFDPRDHFFGNSTDVATGIAYKCGKLSSLAN